jgi:hypothetical protein
MNLESQLVKDYIYLGVYTKNNEEFFCFFQKKEDECYYNILTKEKIDLKIFHEINPYYDLKFFKFIKRIYKENENINEFKWIDFENFESETRFYNILNFFGFKNHKIFFEKEQKQETLDKVIKKIKNYTKRYIGQKNSDVFAKYLKMYDNVLDILTVIPEEILSKNVPFWIKEIYKDKAYLLNNKNFKLVNLSLLKELVEEKFTIEDVVKKENFISNKTKSIETECIEKYRKKCIEMLKDRIKESEVVLLNEKFHAEQKRDTDLLFEIQIISDEMNKLKSDIEDIDYINKSVSEWWPALLYPIYNGLNINDAIDLNLINKISKIQEKCFISISEDSLEKIKKVVLN